MAYQKELEAAKQLAVIAGKAILEIYNRADEKEWHVTYKEENMPLTEADSASNKIIITGLKAAFPEYAVLSEEEKDDMSRLGQRYCFIVDPLDGTKEFLKRNGQFTVNIALSDAGETVMGVIYVPVTGELYYASRGNGAYKEKTTGKKERLSVSAATGKLRGVASSSHGSEKLEKLLQKHGITECIKIGSSLKGCMVAEGRAEIYYRYNPTMEWDTAAMQCIVEESGGIFRQMNDSPMHYNRENCKNDKGFYAINRIENRLY